MIVCVEFLIFFCRYFEIFLVILCLLWVVYFLNLLYLDWYSFRFHRVKFRKSFLHGYNHILRVIVIVKTTYRDYHFWGNCCSVFYIIFTFIFVQDWKKNHFLSITIHSLRIFRCFWTFWFMAINIVRASTFYWAYWRLRLHFLYLYAGLVSRIG